jgi:hypothetical protein
VRTALARLPNMHPSMPKFPRKAARLTLVFAAVLPATALWCTPALAQEIVIRPVGSGQTVTVDQEQLEEILASGTVGPTTYKVRYRKGDAYTRVHIPDGRAASIAELLKGAGVRGSYNYIKVERPDGGRPLILSNNQITRTGAATPAVFLDDSGGLNFIRSSTGPKDVNGRDWIKLGLGSLRLTQTNDSQLEDVFIDCPKQSIDAGDTVTCTARVAGPRGDDYVFEFDFGEGKLEVVDAPGYSGYEIKASHTYEEGGDYEVTVSVTTNGSSDTSDSMRSEEIAVASDEPEDTDQDGVGGTGITGGTSTGGTYSGSSGATTPTPPATDSTTPSYDYDFDTPVTNDGNTVEGNLLAAVSSPSSGSASASAAEAAKAATATFESPDPGGALPPAAWAGLGALVLMTAGAGLESGRRPRLPGRLRLHLPLRRR